MYEPAADICPACNSYKDRCTCGQDSKIKQLKSALEGLMFTEDMLPRWDDDENENPFDIARKLIGKQ